MVSMDVYECQNKDVVISTSVNFIIILWFGLSVVFNRSIRTCSTKLVDLNNFDKSFKLYNVATELSELKVKSHDCGLGFLEISLIKIILLNKYATPMQTVCLYSCMTSKVGYKTLLS